MQQTQPGQEYTITHTHSSKQTFVNGNQKPHITNSLHLFCLPHDWSHNHKQTLDLLGIYHCLNLNHRWLIWNNLPNPKAWCCASTGPQFLRSHLMQTNGIAGSTPQHLEGNHSINSSKTKTNMTRISIVVTIQVSQKRNSPSCLPWMAVTRCHVTAITPHCLHHEYTITCPNNYTKFYISFSHTSGSSGKTSHDSGQHWRNTADKKQLIVWTFNLQQACEGNLYSF